MDKAYVTDLDEPRMQFSRYANVALDYAEQSKIRCCVIVFS